MLMENRTRQVSSRQTKLRQVLSGETPNPYFALAMEQFCFRLFLSRGVKGWTETELNHICLKEPNAERQKREDSPRPIPLNRKGTFYQISARLGPPMPLPSSSTHPSVPASPQPALPSEAHPTPWAALLHPPPLLLCAFFEFLWL